jgi:hypothetical protein
MTHGNQGLPIFDWAILLKLPNVKKKLVDDIWHNRLSLKGYCELASDR